MDNPCRRVREEEVYVMFLDFLDECEGMLRCLVNTVYSVSDAMNQQCTRIHAYNLIIYSFILKWFVTAEKSCLACNDTIISNCHPF